MNKSYDFSLKTIIIGDSTVGKTCLLHRFVRNQCLQDPLATLCVEFLTKTIVYNQHSIVLQLWDTAGQELYRSVTRSYYRNSDVVFFVFDITNQLSFEHLEQWIGDVETSLNGSPFDGIIIGNKADLSEKRTVAVHEAKLFAEKHQMSYFEASAKTGSYVSEAFLSCLEHADQMFREGKIQPSGPKNAFVWMSPQDDGEASKCC